MNLYIDGVWQYTDTYTRTGFNPANTKATTASGKASNTNNGVFLDELILYDRVLDLAEINQVMDNT